VGAGRTLAFVSKLPVRTTRSGRSALSLIDDGLLVVVAVVGALVLLKILGAIVATMWFVVKVAFLAGLIFVVVRAIRSRGR